MKFADCRCFLECLLISLGQPAEVKGHVFPYRCMFGDLFVSVAFLFNILLIFKNSIILCRCTAFIQFIRSTQIRQRRCSVQSVLHSSTNSRLRCQKTRTIYLFQSLCGSGIFTLCIDELCNNTFFLQSFHLDYFPPINTHHVFFLFFFLNIRLLGKPGRWGMAGVSLDGWLHSNFHPAW